jgi:hypothetical protein
MVVDNVWRYGRRGLPGTGRGRERICPERKVACLRTSVSVKLSRWEATNPIDEPRDLAGSPHIHGPHFYRRILLLQHTPGPKKLLAAK